MNWLIREREVHMVSSRRAVGAPSRWGDSSGETDCPRSGRAKQ